MLRTLVLSLGLCLASSVRADDLGDFEAARALYDSQDYARAVDAFRTLVGTDPPRIADRLLLLESRKYLAASLLFVGAQEDAKAQFRLLITEDPGYTLDPLAFPTEVVSVFEQVKAELRRTLEAERKAREAQAQERERKARAAEVLRRENLERLTRLAVAEQVHEKNSRWVATIPFGVGQFQNGQRGLGVALAMAESIAAAVSVISFVEHQQLADDRPGPEELRSARDEEARWRTANYVSFGVFAGLALLGIIDAHVRFVPERVKSQPRPLPPDLDRWVREQGLSSKGPRRRF